MRVLVFALRHEQFPWMSTFPHVRGALLATSLRQLGVDAEFLALPVDANCDVAICADYQGDERYFGVIQRRLTGLSARRWFCMSDDSTVGHFSAPMGEWFAQRGGVLCHLRHRPLAPYEHYIGVGVDAAYDPAAERRAIFFDFPRSSVRDASLSSVPARLAAVRDAHPALHLIGSGPADCAIRDVFDEWID